MEKRAILAALLMAGLLMIYQLWFVQQASHNRYQRRSRRDRRKELPRAPQTAQAPPATAAVPVRRKKSGRSRASGH
jgi:hypothetical protein